MTRKTLSLVAAGLFTVISAGGFSLTSTCRGEGPATAGEHAAPAAGIMRQLRVNNRANCSIGVYANGRLLMTVLAGQRGSWGEISDGPGRVTSLSAKAMDNSRRTWSRTVSGNVSNYDWQID